ncbi:hypothetical protein Tco_0144923 [Tanacetum coccineum]
MKKSSYQKTGRKLQFDAKELVGFDKTKIECYNCHKPGYFAREYRTKGNQDSRRRDAWNSGNKDGRRSGKHEDSKALVTIDGEGVDWTSHSEEEEDYALMACNSSGSDTEVTSCSKECKESYAKLKKLYDEQRAQLSDASIEIQAYTQALKKVEAQLVAHQQGQLWYEEKIRFMKIDLDDKTDVLTYHKKLLAEAEKEKEDLKAKVEKWHNSSKNLGKLLNTQMSANDKFRLGYGDYLSTQSLQNKGIVDSGCSRHMTGNKAYLAEYQVLMWCLAFWRKLKRQEKDANDAAEALRKEFAQETKNLLIKARAAKASSTNIVNTVSTPVSTASPYGGLSFTDPTNPDQDDSKIPALEDIYQHPTDGIFTNSSYDDEGVVADFTNLETVVNKNCCSLRIRSVDSCNLPLEEAIGTKMGYRNKKDERGVVDKIKQVSSQGHRQEGMIDYDEDFAPVARLKH